jgi:hypothetical protein
VPLVAAAGAEPPGRKRIPGRAAAFEKVLRVITIATVPPARCLWTPFTERATNAIELFRLVASRVFLSGFRRLQSFLEEPEHDREAQKLQHLFLYWGHLFTRLRDALRVVFEKKVCNPSSVIDGQLAVGKILVEPKFSVGIFRQRLLQELSV